MSESNWLPRPLRGCGNMGCLLVLVVIGGLWVWSSSPSKLNSSPTPPPAIARATPVPFRPDQVIVPPEQFPIAGYVVRLDQASGNGGWQRIYGLLNRDDGAIAIAIHIIPTDIVDVREYFITLAQRTCIVGSTNATVARDTGPSSSTIGDADRFCVYGYPSAPVTLAYRALTGRYFIEVLVSGSPAVGTTDQINRATSVMRLQVDIIRRLAP